MSVLKTAPSFLMLNKGDNPNTVAWSPEDRLLFAAVSTLEAEKCPHCGVPNWHAHSAHSAIEFELDWHVCYACQSLAEMTENVKNKQGEWATVKPVVAEGFDWLPSRREGYAVLGKPAYDTGNN